ncbi:MAG: recombinase family protein, partial [Oscillospiraceae bacterium]|nr:recombinase family protein [Oscillospiraceae bacterium]
MKLIAACIDNLPMCEEYLPKEEWTVVPNTHEALIDADTFAIVQRMAEERKTTYHERIGKFEY